MRKTVALLLQEYLYQKLEDISSHLTQGFGGKFASSPIVLVSNYLCDWNDTGVLGDIYMELFMYSKYEIRKLR